MEIHLSVSLYTLASVAIVKQFIYICISFHFIYFCFVLFCGCFQVKYKTVMKQCCFEMTKMNAEYRVGPNYLSDSSTFLYSL